MRKKLIILCLFTCVALHAMTVQEQAAQDLIQRVLPDHYSTFIVQIVPNDTLQYDWFEIEQQEEKILLRGTSGVSIASALNYYLEHYTHSRISWNSTNLPPATYHLPPVPEKIHRDTPYRYRYYFNYCTFNYSMSWWNWDRWQREIDFMAMHGINLPLALTGQNSIWQRVYRQMGFTDADLSTFFPGPAYFNWFWMGNLDGWGGPLPQSFIDGQEQLQKQILERERALGMMPILPAFTGHVPPAFRDRFPNAKIKQTHWLDIDTTYILDPEDPLFLQIGTAFLQEYIRTFGTNHFYSSDTFNENTPPQNDSTYLSGISRQIYNAMLQADSNAVWVMQGWLFTQSRDFWQETETRALLDAVPDDHMLILDLWTEAHPVWQRKHAFYGKPWIWCMLNNFGGNNLMYGRMNEVAALPYRNFLDSASGNMCGIGLTPEAIENNPVIYEMMLSHVWQSDSIDILPWLHQYALSRYGQTNDTIDAAWQILYRTVYSGGRGHGGPTASIIAARPTLQKDGRWTETTKTYAHQDLLPALSLLQSQSALLAHSDGYQYDLIDLKRQILANRADSLQQQFAYAYQQGDTATFRICSQQFLQVILDMDTLLSQRPEWCLSTWVEEARAWGTTSAEKDLYERNAKNLITTWGNRDCSIHDYSWRLWSGMLRSFYYVRWQMYIDYLHQCLDSHTTPNQHYFDEQVKDFEWHWLTNHLSPVTCHLSPATCIGVNAHPYDFLPAHDTPAPAGYQPFYISHYGRHGSRADQGWRYYPYLIETLSQAQADSALTPAGDSLLRLTLQINALYGDMPRRLLPLGQQQHAQLAQRMVARYPEVFAVDSPCVRAVSSMVPRCLMSMAAFTNALTAANPHIRYTMDSGERFQEYINCRGLLNLTEDDTPPLIDSLTSTLPRGYDQSLSLLFTKPTYLPDSVRERFIYAVYSTLIYAADFQVPITPTMFLSEQTFTYYDARTTYHFYIDFCNSPYGYLRRPYAQLGLNDIIQKADSAICHLSPVTCHLSPITDLRFGHDDPLLALVSLMEIEGVGTALPYDSILIAWPGAKFLPMAANVQLVFYRPNPQSSIFNPQSSILIKALYNEQECHIHGLTPVESYYYRWSDVREKWLHLHTFSSDQLPDLLANRSDKYECLEHYTASLLLARMRVRLTGQIFYIGLPGATAANLVPPYTSVVELPYTNHQSSITNHQSSITPSKITLQLQANPAYDPIE